MQPRKALIARLVACGLPPEAWRPGKLDEFCNEIEEGDALFDFEQKLRTIHVVIPHIYTDFRGQRGEKARFKLIEYRIIDGRRERRYQHEGSASEKMHFVYGESWQRALLRLLIEEMRLRHYEKPYRLIGFTDLSRSYLFPRAPLLDDNRESSKYPPKIRTERYIYPVALTMPRAFQRREGYVEMHPDGESIKAVFEWIPTQKFRGRVEDSALPLPLEHFLTNPPR